MKRNSKVPAVVETALVAPIVGASTILPITNNQFPVSPVEDILPPDADRVGNLSQKERAAHKVGLTRGKLLSSIMTGLEATRMEVVTDDDGRQHVRTIPDLDKRLKATEMGLKYFGDMKEIAVTGPVTNIRKIIYTWKKTDKINVSS